MTTFLNLDFGSTFNKRYALIHIFFSVIWLLGIAIFVFRLDDILFQSTQYEYLKYLTPLLFTVSIYFLLRKQEWYYFMACMFYPFLVLFWFLPKNILQYGKFYLFWNYIDLIFHRIKNFRRTLFYTLILVMTIVFLVYSPSSGIRYFAISLALFVVFKYWFKYIQKSITPSTLLGKKLKIYLETEPQKDSNEYKLIEQIIVQKTDDNLESEEKRKKQVERIAIMHSIVGNLAEKMSGFQGKRAFVVYWILQFLFIFFLMLFIFSFVNYQLYLIDPSHFKITGDSSFFGFMYYTSKTIVYGNIEAILPQSAWARFIEMLSFLGFGVLLLIIALSLFFSLRQSKVEEDTKVIVNYCNERRELINSYAKQNYGGELEVLIKEVDSIGRSIQEIKKVFDKII